MYTYALLLGLGCGFGCGSLSTPFLSTYIIGKGLNVKEGYKSLLVFSLGKILSMLILGILASLLSSNFISETSVFLNIKLTTYFDVFMISMGIYVIYNSLKMTIKKETCSCLAECTRVSLRDRIDHDALIEQEGETLKGYLILFLGGIFYGLTPCVPLIIIMTTCATLPLVSAISYMGFFAIITCLSPVITSTLIAGLINNTMKRELKNLRVYIQILAGALLIGVGLLPLI